MKWLIGRADKQKARKADSISWMSTMLVLVMVVAVRKAFDVKLAFFK